MISWKDNIQIRHIREYFLSQIFLNNMKKNSVFVQIHTKFISILSFTNNAKIASNYINESKFLFKVDPLEVEAIAVP